MTFIPSANPIKGVFGMIKLPNNGWVTQGQLIELGTKTNPGGKSMSANVIAVPFPIFEMGEVVGHPFTQVAPSFFDSASFSAFNFTMATRISVS